MLQVIKDIITREGGYVNNPNDLGGPTKYGITLATLSEWRNTACSALDVEQLTEQEASDIYEAKYAKPFNMWMQYPELYNLIVDSAVQHGVGRVNEWLETIIVTTQDPHVVYKHMLRKRIKFYGRIITKRVENAVFAEGWMNRVSEFVR